MNCDRPIHPFYSHFSTTTWGSHNRKGKTLLDSNKVSDDGVMGWNWHWLDHIQTICTLLQADNDINTSSLYGQMLFLTPKQQCQSIEGNSVS